jgi:hypothetical protein
MRPFSLGAAAALAAAGGYATLYRLGQTWGATDHEQRKALAGDELLPEATALTTHAITIAAPPNGCGRGWCRWAGTVAAGTPPGRSTGCCSRPTGPAPPSSFPSCSSPQVGDHIPDGPPNTGWFMVEHIDPPHLLVLHSTTHLPASWQVRRGAAIDWTWTFALTPTGEGGTRLLLRVRGQARPWWLTAAYMAALVPADYVMAHSMVAGISLRV